MPFVIFRRDHLRFTSGIICGSGSFAVRDHLRSNLGIICGRGSFAALYRTPGQSDFKANSHWLLKNKGKTTGSYSNPQHGRTSENSNKSSEPGLSHLQRKHLCEESVLERFFELKIAFDDGLPSYICRCCHHKLVKFQEFLRKIAFSRQQQESVLRVKRGKTKAESPSGRSPQTRRDLKKRRINDDAPAKGPSLRLFQMDKPSKTRPRTILPAPSAEGDGKKRKLPKRTESSAEPSTPPKQEEILSQSGLLNPLVL